MEIESVAALSGHAAAASRRYDEAFDATTGSHAAVLGMVADGATVLDLGCAGGSLARELSARGCRVVGVEADVAGAAHAAEHLARLVACDLDTADLAAALDGERFHVVVAADVLEHLRDPARVLQQLVPLLAPGGSVVASIPNVAHGSVRLALLSGDFPYGDWGLLDRTHLRFYTAEGVHALLAESGLQVAEMLRVVEPVDSPAAVAFDASAVPADVVEWVAAQPEATTYQFVVRAVPASGATAAPAPVAPGARSAADPLQAVLAYQAAALSEMERVVASLREALAHEESRTNYRDRLIDELLACRAVRGVGALRRLESALLPGRARPTLADSIRARRDGNV